MKLFEVVENIDYLLQQMDEAQSEEEEQIYRDTIESLDYDLETSIENITKSIKNLEAAMMAYKDQADFFAEKAKRADNKIARRKGLIKWAMEKRGKDKVKAGNFDVRIQANGGKQGLEYLVSYDKLPDQLSRCEVVYSPVEDKIREALERGEDLSQYVKLKERGSHLRIS